MAPSSYKAKQMIVMRRDLKMRKGKIAAQSGHACVEAILMALAHEGRLTFGVVRETVFQYRVSGEMSDVVLFSKLI